MGINIDNLQKYELYLNVITKQLNKFFEEQSPYIFCKEGCSTCCEKGEYPFSELEIKYLMLGFSQLPTKIQMEILKNTNIIIEEKKKLSENEKYMYQCPFLIDHRCSLYNFRGLICRSHGLAFFNQKGKLCVPHCTNDGLNYANVYDFETQTISQEKYKATGIEVEPLAHNVGLGFLTDNNYTKENNIEFGEIKPMIDWFLNELK